jgi:sugar/nucleoside kinase (ribokinase family)
VLWQRDPALNVAPGEWSSGLLEGAEIVHVDAVDETASIHLASLARASGATVTCDIDRVTTRTVELLATITHPILAADVPAALTGVSDVEASLRALRAQHAGVLCVTLGERGSAALDGDRFLFVPAFHVQVVDSTGAGDVFRAGFIYGLVQGWPTEDVLRFGNAAAAVNCTRAGAMAGVPRLQDVTALMNR